MFYECEGQVQHLLSCWSLGLPIWLSLDTRGTDQAKGRPWTFASCEVSPPLSSWAGALGSFQPLQRRKQAWPALDPPLPSRHLQMAQSRKGEHLQPPETRRDYLYLVQATITAHLDDSQDLLTALPILSWMIFVKCRSNHVTSHHCFSTHCSLDKIPILPDLLPRLTLSPLVYSSTTLNSLRSPGHTVPSPTLESERILLLLLLLTYPWMLVIPGYCCISESSMTPEVGMGIFYVPMASLSNSLILNRLCIHTCLKIQTTLKNVE